MVTPVRASSVSVLLQFYAWPLKPTVSSFIPKPNVEMLGSGWLLWKKFIFYHKIKSSAAFVMFHFISKIPTSLGFFLS